MQTRATSIILTLLRSACRYTLYCYAYELQVEEVVLLDTNSSIIVSPDNMSRKNMTWDIAGDCPMPYILL
jgi:hypothetical protein